VFLAVAVPGFDLEGGGGMDVVNGEWGRGRKIIESVDG